MKGLPLRPSPEYELRVRRYALDLKERYGREVAYVFIQTVKKVETRIRENCNIGTSAPYIFDDQHVVLQELYFMSGPKEYCLIFEITESHAGLVTLWHGSSSRQANALYRVWKKEPD